MPQTTSFALTDMAVDIRSADECWERRWPRSRWCPSRVPTRAEQEPKKEETKKHGAGFETHLSNPGGGRQGKHKEHLQGRKLDSAGILFASSHLRIFFVSGWDVGFLMFLVAQASPPLRRFGSRWGRRRTSLTAGSFQFFAVGTVGMALHSNTV